MFYDTMSLKESIHHKLQKTNNEGGRHAFPLFPCFWRCSLRNWSK